MEEKDTIITRTDPEGKRTLLESLANLLSILSTPFMTPVIGFVLLFSCTHLRLLPPIYISIVLGIVVCFTLCMPMLIIYLFQKVNGWNITDLKVKEKRFLPYLLTIISYTTCLISMNRLHLPRYMSGIILAALICITLCTVINIKYKISTHAASTGLLVGGLVSYGFLFGFNPIGALCIAILWSGLIGTARIILNQHTLFEVLAGFVAGMFCGVIGILFI